MEPVMKTIQNGTMFTVDYVRDSVTTAHGTHWLRDMEGCDDTVRVLILEIDGILYTSQTFISSDVMFARITFSEPPLRGSWLVVCFSRYNDEWTMHQTLAVNETEPMLNRELVRWDFREALMEPATV